MSTRTRVRWIVRRRVPADQVDDLVQETFVRALRARHTLRDPHAAASWLAAIANNLCVDWARSSIRAAKLGPLDESDVAERAEDGADPADAFAAKQHGSVIATCMKQVSPRHRRLLLLREVEGMNYVDIADHERVPVSVVKSALRRARQAFRDAYAEATAAGGALVGYLRSRFAGLRHRAAEMLVRSPGLTVGAILSEGVANLVATAAVVVAVAAGGTQPSPASRATLHDATASAVDPAPARAPHAADAEGRAVAATDAPRWPDKRVVTHSAAGGGARTEAATSIERDKKRATLTTKISGRLPGDHVIWVSDDTETPCDANEFRDQLCAAIDKVPGGQE